MPIYWNMWHCCKSNGRKIHFIRQGHYMAHVLRILIASVILANHLHLKLKSFDSTEREYPLVSEFCCLVHPLQQSLQCMNLALTSGSLLVSGSSLTSARFQIQVAMTIPNSLSQFRGGLEWHGRYHPSFVLSFLSSKRAYFVELNVLAHNQHQTGDDDWRRFALTCEWTFTRYTDIQRQKVFSAFWSRSPQCNMDTGNSESISRFLDFLVSPWAKRRLTLSNNDFAIGKSSWRLPQPKWSGTLSSQRKNTERVISSHI